MNLEGQVRNTISIGNVRPYASNVKGNNVVLYSFPDRTSLNETLDKYMDRNTIVSMAYSSPETINLLKSKDLALNPNIRAFRKNVYQHSIDTKNTAIGIYNNLPEKLKQEVNLRDLSQAALLHDIGKVLIPEKILAKKGSLSESEKDIMQLHSSLSSALLKNQGLNENTLNIIKYHHQNPEHSGYPLLAYNNIDLSTQIVSLADKYSALKEKRSYKHSMTSQEALKILYNEVDKGVSKDVYNALFDYSMSTNNTKNAKTLSSYLNLANIIPQQTKRAV